MATPDIDESLLKIYCSSNKCLIWNVKDCREVREEHRIVGTLVGSLPRAPRQNSHLGLPLELMPEEVTLLVEKGVAVVVEKVYGAPTEKDKTDQAEVRKASYQEQIGLFQQERREEMKRYLPGILEGKKNKRRKRLEARGETVDEEELKKELEVDPDTITLPAIKEDHALIHLPIEALPRESTTCRPVDWKYPETPAERLRYEVFRDFWEKGNFLTSGRKFGGDFLVYPGDPARYHSFYVATCLDHDREISALDIITMGRLGSNVKKTAVMCSRDKHGNICHTSLQWTGIS